MPNLRHTWSTYYTRHMMVDILHRPSGMPYMPSPLCISSRLITARHGRSPGPAAYDATILEPEDQGDHRRCRGALDAGGQ